MPAGLKSLHKHSFSGRARDAFFLQCGQARELYLLYQDAAECMMSFSAVSGIFLPPSSLQVYKI